MELSGSLIPARLRRIDATSWYAMFPGAFLVMGAGIYVVLTRSGPLAAVSPELAAMRDTIQAVLYAAIVLMTVLGLLLKTRLFTSLTLRPGNDGSTVDIDSFFQQFQARKFILAGLIDAPMVISVGMAIMLNAPILALVVTLWSLVPALFCRPSLETSLRNARAFQNPY